jgi:hypothetical protein
MQVNANDIYVHKYLTTSALASRLLSRPKHSESDNEEEERPQGYSQEDVENQDDDARFLKRQRIEVELTMPELPLPVSKDGKVCFATQSYHLYRDRTITHIDGPL